VLRAITQCPERAFHRRVAKHSIQSFANGRKNHAGASGFHARGGSAFADLSKNRRGGVTGDYRDGNDAAAGGFHFFAADDLIAGPVAAFHQHVREQTGDDFARRGFVKNHYRVDAFERRENFGTLAFRQDGASGTLQLANAGVAVEADDERVAESASLLEAADMPGMQQIEAAIREDDSAAVAFLAAKPQNRFFEGKNLRVQRNSMKSQANTALAFDEKLVYHARHRRRSQAGQLR
jgi:hypothetical protein